jgi:hypothetical protein
MCASKFIKKAFEFNGLVYPALANYRQLPLPYQIGTPQSLLLLNTETAPAIPQSLDAICCDAFYLDTQAQFPYTPHTKKEVLITLPDFLFKASAGSKSISY